MTLCSVQRLASRWREVRSAAGSPHAALGHVLLYAALRGWALIISCFPIAANLRTARLMGQVWWHVYPRSRERALENLRHALGTRYSERDLQRIARESLEHFAQLYLVELVMTPRLINPWSWPRYVRLGDLAPVLRELLVGRGAIMLTAHFGNYELSGFTIARLGIPITAVMRPLDNLLINEYLVRTREASGITLLYKKGVTEHAEEVLRRGGTLCFIADQDAGRKGVFAEFFGRPASWYKSIGLLAMQHRVPIVVGCAARVRAGFQYEISVEQIIRPEEWEAQQRPLEWVTQEYAAALERAIRRHPEQYLWAHRRWKTQPKNPAAAAEATSDSDSAAARTGAAAVPAAPSPPRTPEPSRPGPG